jgi:hypothetical protein
MGGATVIARVFPGVVNEYAASLDLAEADMRPWVQCAAFDPEQNKVELAVIGQIGCIAAAATGSEHRTAKFAFELMVR